MAAKKDSKSASPELAIAALFAASAAALRTQADTFDALGKLYQGVDTALAAGATAGPGDATPAANGPKPATLDETKNVLMELIGKLGNDRTKVNEIIAKHAGKVMAIKDVPADKYGAIVADAKLALAELANQRKPVSADDL